MLIAVGSLRGSPGVSRLAMSLTALWPGEDDAVLMECDAAGGTLAVRFGLASSPSITSLAANTFRDAASASISDHVQRLPGGLPVVPAPADPAKVSAAIGDLAAPGGYLGMISGPEGDRTVIADCGRLDTRTLTPVVSRADAIVLVVRPTPEDVAITGAALSQLRGLDKHVVLVTRGAGYDADELGRSLGIPARAVPEMSARTLFVRSRQAAYSRAVLHLAQQLRQAGLRPASTAVAP
jgi:MinD-like ATPase involved in chromosome partitioning or flagellar assembly